ncbi:MAG: hypothetical protein KL787_08725 [Taibaiella sp.]|nr:hypothetical protein [Taibaiella sp.]
MIRKSLSVVLLSILGLSASYAQSGPSGFPWSFNQNLEVVPTEKYEFPATDNSGLMDAAKSGPYMVASTFDVSLSFPGSGVLTRLNNGSYIWSVTLNVDEAKGIGTYFNRFNLPEGVSMYLYNENKRHIQGPFTIEDIDLKNNNFATSAIQGNLVTLELNIDAGVDFNAIDLSINTLASYFRGVDELEYYSDDYRYGTIDAEDENAYGGSSQCTINANCPQSEGFEVNKNATVKEIIFTSGAIGYCTGTFVNNTGNSEGSCTKYLLTATHCEGDNATGGEYYSQWILKFNYQTPGCEMTDVAPVSNERVGVEFVSRDPYDASADASALDADFLLLKFTKAIPSTWNVTMSGWDNDPGHTRAYLSPKKFMFFHHPAGDIKKTVFDKKY